MTEIVEEIMARIEEEDIAEEKHFSARRSSTRYSSVSSSVSSTWRSFSSFFPFFFCVVFLRILFCLLCATFLRIFFLAFLSILFRLPCVAFLRVFLLLVLFVFLFDCCMIFACKARCVRCWAGEKLENKNKTNNSSFHCISPYFDAIQTRSNWMYSASCLVRQSACQEVDSSRLVAWQNRKVVDLERLSANVGDEGAAAKV